MLRPGAETPDRVASPGKDKRLASVRRTAPSSRSPSTSVAVGASPETQTFSPRPFRPPAWAPGAHAQTLAGKLLRPRPSIRLRRERWETPDGDLLLLDFADRPVQDARPPARPAPLVLVLHGLEGHALRPYALLAYQALNALGVDAVGLNFRGCGGAPNLRPRSYHSGETGDPRWLLERLSERWPERPLGALGFSLGGNVLLKLLGELGSDGAELLTAAVVVSVPFDLAAGADAFEDGFMMRAYARLFLRSLIGKLKPKRSLLEPLVALEAAARAPTIRAFDDLVTAPLHGFRDARHYYESCSSVRYLERVRVPTLVLHSRDDPFLPAAALPEAALRANPALSTVLTDRGGHVGFVEGLPWAPRFWAESEAARFLAWGLGR